MDIIHQLSPVLHIFWESTSTTVEGFWGLLGLGAFTLVFVLFTLRAWNRRPFAIRALPAVQRARAAVGRAMETGEGVDVALGTGRVGDLNTADTLAGLSLVSYLAKRGAQAEIPVHVRVAEPTALAAALASLQQGAQSTGYPQTYHPRQGEFVAPSPLGYGAGVAAAMGRDPVALNALVGTFGPEMLLIAQAGLHSRTIQVGGTSAPTIQPLFYSTMDAALIGEEIYALGAALDRPEHTGSLATQDLFRAAIAVGILAATVLALVGKLS